MTRILENFDILHDVNPGKHFYQFYRSPDDLLKVLIPYWSGGIKKGDYCFWVLPSLMIIEDAVSQLREMIPNIDTLFQKKKFEIVSHDNWYGDGTNFNIQAMIQKYTDKIQEAVRRGFTTVRIAGDMSGFKTSAWQAVQEYERVAQDNVKSLPCIALCSYPLHDLSLHQTKQVLDHHHGVLVAKV